VNNVEIGRWGEDLATAFLLGKGYAVIEKNYRWRGGEIDIIIRKNNILVFCEVKTRKNSRFGYGSEAVTWKKQRKIIQTAMLYLCRTEQNNCVCRFDIVEILLEDGPRIQHFENAFGA